MSEAVKQALAAARRDQKTIGNTPVFPAPGNLAEPCGRHLLDDWLRKAHELSGVALQPQGMWHSLRRKWATERKGYPVKDVAFAGGWRTERTMLSSYQQADAETVRQVVLHCEKLTTQLTTDECGLRRHTRRVAQVRNLDKGRVKHNLASGNQTLHPHCAAASVWQTTRVGRATGMPVGEMIQSGRVRLQCRNPHRRQDEQSNS